MEKKKSNKRDKRLNFIIFQKSILFLWSFYTDSQYHLEIFLVHGSVKEDYYDCIFL